MHLIELYLFLACVIASLGAIYSAFFERVEVDARPKLRVVRKRVKRVEQPLSNMQKMHSAIVQTITDGDTIKVMLNGVEKTVRFYGCDTPEYSETNPAFRQPYGKEAKQFTCKLLKPGMEVTLKERGDSYGRMVAEVFKGSQCINLELIKHGLAWVDQRYCKNKTYLAELEQVQKDKKGIWSQRKPQAPWDFRQQQKAKRAA